VNKKDKLSQLQQDFEDFETTYSDLDTEESPAPQTKRMRRINPLGMRVVVKILPETQQTESGLYLPEGAKQQMAESLLAEVVEVASAIDDHTEEETNVSGVPLGALVLVKKEIGVKVPWDDALRIVETKDILAVIHEVAIS
jgi:co-chaperonin GroES (HSP10)